MEAQLFQAKMTEIDPSPDRATKGQQLSSGAAAAGFETDGHAPKRLSLRRWIVWRTAKLWDVGGVAAAGSRAE